MKRETFNFWDFPTYYLKKCLASGKAARLLTVANTNPLFKLCRRSYNEATRLVQAIALQYLTCDEENHADASNLLKAMQDADRLAYMRQDTMSQCMADPWFAEYFNVNQEPGVVNSTLKKNLLLRLPHKASQEKPLTDTKVWERLF